MSDSVPPDRAARAVGHARLIHDHPRSAAMRIARTNTTKG
jgi:hypothetical protein